MSPVLLCLLLFLKNDFVSCKVLGKTLSDELEKRTVDAPSGGVSLHFDNGGMRNLIVNGQGASVQKQVVVAFQATLTSGHLGPNYADGAIKFNDVSLNIGNGYKPSSGKFTAPVGGLYQFTASYLQQNGYTSYVRLMKDNTVLSDIHANHKNYDQLTKTILVTLKKGDTFWVKLEKNSIYAVYGTSRYTEFGGFLVSDNYE